MPDAAPCYLRRSARLLNHHREAYPALGVDVEPRVFFFFQAEDGIRDDLVTGVQTCALPISHIELNLDHDHLQVIVVEVQFDVCLPSVASSNESSNPASVFRACTRATSPTRDRKSVV